MVVTTREYNITQATPENIVKALQSALVDLNWMDAEALGYALTFTNTPGSIVRGAENIRYLVNASATTSSGTDIVFDVLRSQTGAIAAITIVTGGSGYKIFGLTGASSSGTTVTVADTAGIQPGMVITKVSGTGTILANTTVVSVTNSTQFVISETPSVALSAAAIQLADTVTISAASIGGSEYTKTATGTSGQTTITVSNNTNLLVGQVVTGTGISSLVTVTAIAGNVITLSKANIGTVSGNIVFSDRIITTLTGVANVDNIPGTAAGLTITNVATNANIYVGARVTVTSGTPVLDTSDNEVFISTITGTGPFTITLRNNAGTFRGFDSAGSITFKASNGSTSTWFDSDVFTSPLTSAWGVLKTTNAVNKKLGTTFWSFLVLTTAAAQQPVGGTGPTIFIRSSPGFNPSTNAQQGVGGYDWVSAPAVTTATIYNTAIRISSTPLVPLVLRVRQSGVDPNFASFSFIEGNNNRNPFFLSKYNNAIQPWDLDDVFLGSAFEVFPLITYNTSDAGINFRTRFTAIPKRQAEAGYGNYFQTDATTLGFTNTFFRTSSGNRAVAPLASYGDVMLYTRISGDIQNDVSDVAIFKNVPICPAFAPVPYYLPEDFIIAEIPYGNPNLGDTITVSGSEIYTIAQFSVNQVTYTGIVLAARTT